MQENVWQVQEAKAKFSALVRAAEHYPQTVTMHGKAKVVMMSLPMFRLLAKGYEKEEQAAMKASKTGETGQHQESHVEA